MSTKKELKTLRQKFHVILKSILKKFPPKSAKKRKELERKIIEAENREFRRALNNAKVRQNWLQEDIENAMNNLMVTIELENHIRRAKPVNRTWLSK